MKRRKLILASGAWGALIAARASAQQVEKIHRIGYLGIGPVQPAADFERNPFARALRERGWINGKNIVYELRYAASEKEVQPIAAALVKSGVEVIAVLGGVLAAAVRRETTTIPIVTLAAGDLVATGLVASLARPGGNVTGIQVLQTDLAGKRLSILRELIPGLKRAVALGGSGVAGNPAGDAFFARVERDLARAGSELGVTTQLKGLSESTNTRAVFTEMMAQQTQALLVMGGSATFNRREEIFELALKNRLPTICDTRSYVAFGCLVSYGFSAEEIGQRAAAIVEKILKGANPADLPVEQPTKFEFLINLKTAKALGVKIPQSVLIRADEVIE